MAMDSSGDSGRTGCASKKGCEMMMICKYFFFSGSASAVVPVFFNVHLFSHSGVARRAPLTGCGSTQVYPLRGSSPMYPPRPICTPPPGRTPSPGAGAP